MLKIRANFQEYFNKKLIKKYTFVSSQIDRSLCKMIIIRIRPHPFILEKVIHLMIQVKHPIFTHSHNKFDNILRIWNDSYLYILHTLFHQMDGCKRSSKYSHSVKTHETTEKIMNKIMRIRCVCLVIKYWINRIAFGFNKPSPFRINSKNHQKTTLKTLGQLSKM